jgi:hypothetical protein
LDPLNKEKYIGFESFNLNTISTRTTYHRGCMNYSCEFHHEICGKTYDKDIVRSEECWSKWDKIELWCYIGLIVKQRKQSFFSPYISLGSFKYVRSKHI